MTFVIGTCKIALLFPNNKTIRDMSRLPAFKLLLVSTVILIAGCEPQVKNPAVAGADLKAKPDQVAPATANSPAPKAHEGPFGLAMGVPVSELTKQMGFTPIDAAPGIYIGTPPKPLQDVSQFVAVAAPKAGVCRLQAEVPVPVANGAGEQIKARVDQLAEMMQVKYGKYSMKADDIDQDVYRRNPQYWMLGLQDESVIYGYSWSAGKTQQALPNDIVNIEISAAATGLDKGVVKILYSFRNFDDCANEMKAQKASSL